MIHHCAGSIFDAKVEALVNPVNCVGVMGKGLAKEFKERYPINFDTYVEGVKRGMVELGKVLAVEVFNRAYLNFIINFPTKYHWKDKSYLGWIEKGLDDLLDKMEAFNIKSIAIPALGCGNGGLDWREVKPIIEDAMKWVDAEVYLYGPYDGSAAI